MDTFLVFSYLHITEIFFLNFQVKKKLQVSILSVWQLKTRSYVLIFYVPATSSSVCKVPCKDCLRRELNIL